MRIVIDTNVIASAIFFGGAPREVVSLLMKNSLQAYATKEILDEYKETFEYLVSKYPAKPAGMPLAQILNACQVIEKQSDVRICRDPADNKFIGCALDAKAMYIVSGDKDLLVLQRYKDIDIVTVRDFLEKFSEFES
ncbi:MAG: putative toxin-antitoxin system toxin component, PIN family [Eubacteriales bacterium]|nr:putative toxin-antitoxin system toxin component, PIN family [Eubacteriales bacterium]